MRAICLTLGGAREEKARAHFAERGVPGVRFFPGFDAAALGLRTLNPYEVDAPGSGFNMGPKPTGIWLGHRAIWSACLVMDPEGQDAENDTFLILEDDALFEEGWQQRFAVALAHMPFDWNVIFLGSCCTVGKPTTHIAGEVYEVRWPMCLQAYLVRRRALKEIIASQDRATLYGPVDITLTFHTFPSLPGVYTILPTLVRQHDMILPP
jgi:GR25 family glycosyltransferase involved in LPS biosynthesis